MAVLAVLLIHMERTAVGTMKPRSTWGWGSQASCRMDGGEPGKV